jgi:hypothetical protein
MNPTPPCQHRNASNGELLGLDASLDVRLGAVEQQCQRFHREIYGNGHDGLSTRLSKIEVVEQRLFALSVMAFAALLTGIGALFWKVISTH